MTFFLYAVVSLLSLCGWSLLKALRINQHWKNHGIPAPTALPFFGNMLPAVLGIKPMGKIFREIYEAFPDEPVVGYYHFTQPRLLIRDTRVIDRIFVREFAHFPWRGGFADLADDPLNANLFNLSGNSWRTIRAKFSPMFTTGKLRHMQQHVKSVAENFIDLLAKTGNQPSGIDRIKTYTIDVLSTTAFGIEPGAMEDENNEFRTKGRDIMPPTLMSFFRVTMIFVMPYLAQKLGINFSPPGQVKYFTDAFKNVLEHRRSIKTVRNDFVQAMLSFQEKGSVDVVRQDSSDDYLQTDDGGLTIEPTDDLLAGQAFGFMIAGFDATAISLTMMVLDLAIHPEMQEVVRAEVERVLAPSNGDVTFDNMKEMTYLEGFMKESLRLNSTVPFLMRKCIKPFRIPEIGYTLSPGENIVVSVEGIHMDPKHYPDPETIRPNRWQGDNRFQSNTFLPFGYGPRICIGLRFAQMEMTSLLAKLLLKYKISLHPSTEIPIKLNPYSFFTEPHTKVLFNFEKLKSE